MPTPSDIIIHDCVIFNAFAGNHHEGDSIQRHQILQGCTESFKQEIVLYAWVLLTKALHILLPMVCELSQHWLFFYGCSDGMSQIHLHRHQFSNVSLSCSFCTWLNATMSSIMITVPFLPQKYSRMLFWNISEAKFKPNGNLNQWNHPKRMWNVVNLLDASSSFIGQWL